MATIIDGKAVSLSIKEKLKERIESVKEEGERVPCPMFAESSKRQSSPEWRAACWNCPKTSANKSCCK